MRIVITPDEHDPEQDNSVDNIVGVGTEYFRGSGNLHIVGNRGVNAIDHVAELIDGSVQIVFDDGDTKRIEESSISTVHPSRTVDIEMALRDLIAIERDRLLGYSDGELHTSPEQALEDALDVLEGVGADTDELLPEDDRDRLNL